MKTSNCGGSSAPCGSGFCGCCEGTKILTPLSTANRPGLSALSYRIGTHASFLETMKARLASKDHPELAGLTARDSSDPSIALLDAWAAVADVLTFYQERIANEGYLRTATERRSVLELGRLTGYAMRPGVSASAFLAYTLDQNSKDEVVIPASSRAQSVPGPGELPQTFESSEDLKARSGWNNLRPRMTQPQTVATIKYGSQNSSVTWPRVYLKGINTNLKPNEPLLIDFGDGKPELHWIKEITQDAKADCTLVILRRRSIVLLLPDDAMLSDVNQSIYVKFNSNSDNLNYSCTIASTNKYNDTGRMLVELELSSDQPSSYSIPDLLISITFVRQEIIVIDTRWDPIVGRTIVILGNDLTPDVRPSYFFSANLIHSLVKRPSLQLANQLRMGREIGEQFAEKADTSYRALTSAVPLLRGTLAAATANAIVASEKKIKIYALRKKAAPFGHNAPLRAKQIRDRSDRLAIKTEYTEWRTDDHLGTDNENSNAINLIHEDNKISLNIDCNINNDDWVVITNQKYGSIIKKPVNVVYKSIAGYGISGPTAEVTLPNNTNWIKGVQDFSEIRETIVYCEPEELTLAEEHIDTPVGKQEDEKADDRIELDGFYEDLESGRWVIVSGEREIKGTGGVHFSELAMLSSVEQTTNSTLPNEKTHTFVKFAKQLEYAFKRDTVKIYGNVVKASHGETRREVLGSGDGSKALQAFTLKQKPLTHVAASNPTGTDSTLKVFVNDIRWHEAETLADRESTDRNFITTTDDDNNTSIVFGNGEKGARLPTGIENIKAEYRSGIGKAGNVKAEQISLLMNRPLGLKEVINPLRASGGADREGRDQARKNVPLAVRALDRLVSVQDYEDFARVYAGIGKAKAVELTDGRHQLVHVTIAGTEDIPIDETSDLFQNLFQALHEFGDPYQPIRLAVRELMLMVVSANIRIKPDYQWEPVVTELRNAMLDAFSFERRELGQDVLLSEVLSVMQSVRGVEYVDIDLFGGIPERIQGDGYGDERRLLTPEEISSAVELLSKQWQNGNLLTSDEISNAIWCQSCSRCPEEYPDDEDDLEVYCAEYGLSETDCKKYIECKKYICIESTKKIRQRLEVNLANFEYGTIRPAQLAFLTPDVPETLILNPIK